ncbi:hypothetical protein DFJ73DRAFT_806223 [Zopfochytrium polystomum]|nr:hypothetical protein DFJ73DRAFT_806223 [Zopfochytrium polystomum]
MVQTNNKESGPDPIEHSNLTVTGDGRREHHRGPVKINRSIRAVRACRGSARSLPSLAEPLQLQSFVATIQREEWSFGQASLLLQPLERLDVIFARRRLHCRLVDASEGPREEAQAPREDGGAAVNDGRPNDAALRVKREDVGCVGIWADRILGGFVCSTALAPGKVQSGPSILKIWGSVFPPGQYKRQ